MNIAESILLSHVFFGALALVTAFLAAMTKKGAQTHRRIGTVYFWSMFGVAATAIAVTFFRPNPFLFFIAIFSFYMAFAGYRRGKSKFQPSALDTVAGALMAVIGIAMAWNGIEMVLTARPLGWALVAFAGLGISFAVEDVITSRKSMNHSNKVQIHLARMLGGTIATITAVLVQQVTPLVPSDLARLTLWLGPTVLITPMIFFWNYRIQKTRRYRLSS